jgi:hypothetical protein
MFGKFFASFSQDSLDVVRHSVPMLLTIKQEYVMQRYMTGLFTLLMLIASVHLQAAPYFQGEPKYTDQDSRELAAKVLAAHGGMQPWSEAESLQFKFFTKMINNPMPFYSRETINIETGAAYIDWLLFDATVAWDNEKLWSSNWPVPLPAGFFVRLTTSFMTLPWQIHADTARVGPVSQGEIPEGDGVIYDVIRVTFEKRSPSMPGTFYDLFVDPENGLMKAIRFDINHPGMVANPNQPLGPNFHVFYEYRKIGGLIIPTYYESWGQGSAKGGKSNAVHVAFDISLDQSFDDAKLTPPEGATVDHISMDWWQGMQYHQAPADSDKSSK